MADDQSQRVTSRIPVTPEVHQRLRDFAKGLNATYDETLDYILDIITAGNNPMITGLEHRNKFQGWMGVDEDA